ncbi:MurR/RpiR family transcriptional regulator [uncultured Clostridium sp.]|uniref:MurR/RpiR family transcriptional regulator n=1 Tax=uncultured Clostridium sp. TaxID=59620 RepID=UPI002636575A|nr:MurR/RpiR family transcriptional regulator [uncultured Clostridium sp.]
MFELNEISKLNELELEVYKYIVNNKNKVIYMRIRELADLTHVSTTTVLRVCKKFGCDGFSEFKIKLKMYLKESNEVIIKDDKSIIIEFLNRTETEEFKKTIEDIATLLNDYETIFCVGFGSSGVMASYAARHLSGMGKFALNLTDPFYPIEQVSVENSVSLVFSVEGENGVILDYLKSVKYKQGKIISITNSRNSTLAKLSDLNLSYYVQIQKNGTHQLTTQVPVIYMIEKIAEKLNEIRNK